MYVRTYVLTHCVYVLGHVCMYVCMHGSSVCMYVRMYVCMYVFMYVCNSCILPWCATEAIKCLLIDRGCSPQSIS